MKVFSLVVLSILLVSCEDPVQKNEPKKEVETKEVIDEIIPEEIEDTIIPEQTVEERIADIKGMYAEVQGRFADGAKNCQKWSKKHVNSDITDDMTFEFENHAELCPLGDGYTLKKVNLNGYEWGSETIIYFKDDKIFFAYVTGGSEGWAYEQRIYYNRDENPIRILEDENEGDGEKPSNRKDMTNKKRGDEILKELKEIESEFEDIRKSE